MWVLYAILSAFFASVMSITIKIGLKDLNPYLSLTIRCFFVFVFCVVLLLFSKKGSLLIKDIKAINGRIFWWMVLVSVATFLTWLFYFLALDKSSVQKVMAIDKLSIILTVIFGALFLSETITFKTIMGILLLVLGSLLIVFS